MFKNKNAFLSLFCSLVAFACPVVSSAQTDTTKTEQLKEVQVKANRLFELQSSATPVQLLFGNELKRINSLSVADAIRYFSGVQIKDYGGIGGLKTINVRSMGSNHTAVFYDGIQLGNAQNGQIDLGKYSLDNIEEIAVYIGQKDELLMPAKGYSAASALYLKSRIPKFENGQQRNFRVSLKGGSFGLINPALNFDQKIGKLALNINAELLNANGKYKYRYTNTVYDTTVVRHNADIFSRRIEAGLYGLTADSSRWNVKMYNYNSERGIPGAIVANKFDFSQRQLDDNFFVQSSFQSRADRKYQILANAKYAYDFMRYLDPEWRALAVMDNKYTHQEWYLSLAQEYNVTNFLKLSLSTDYTRQQLDANLYDFAYPTRQTALVALATKFHWQNFNVQSNVLATFVNDEVKSNIPAGNKAEYTPTIMASWKPFANEDLRLRVLYKSIFRMPTFNDLYYTRVGNTVLKPEYTHQYNFGATYMKSYEKQKLTSFSIQTDAYFNQIENKIVAVPGNDLFSWKMMNLDEVEIKGLTTNIQTSWRFGYVNAQAKLNYTYEQAVDKTPNGFSYNHQIPYTPWHSGSLLLATDYKNFGFNYSYIYTGERYSQKANIPVNYIQPWYTHDLSMQYAFKYAKVNYRIATELNNLFNQYYDVVLNYPMPGRNFRISLIANFN
ncbi:MAG: TonB-dependent receptor [Flavobacteriales bacterium]|nr:MAG: TonB-dependent receptor [Flavobacteriales bacterium]